MSTLLNPYLGFRNNARQAMEFYQSVFGGELTSGTPGTNYSVSLSGEDDAELRGYWDKLSDGGSVALPLEQAPWGDSFGMCVDRFGVSWMVNISQPAS